MGLTHYWERPIELPVKQFAEAVRDVERAVLATGVPLAGFERAGKPIFRDDMIVFNGEGRSGVEPFQISQTEFDRRGRSTVLSYCKTEGAPYDACVRAALIVLKHHLGEQFKVSSDCREPEDVGWKAAREFCQRMLGYGTDFVLTPG